MTRVRARAAVLAATAATVATAAAPGCARGPDAETRRRTATVAEALRPSFYVAALRKMGGAHYHATARFGASGGGAGTGANAGSSEAVTTTTDVWLDRQGNYRLLEVNDRDGGREVIRTGRELAVALRYGKMIRRTAEEPEPTHLLEEALGAPWAAWEVLAGGATVARAGSELVGGAKATVYALERGAGAAAAASSASEPAAAGAAAPGSAGPADPVGAPPASLPAAGLRAWRGTLAVNELAGRVLVDDASGAVMRADLKGGFTASQAGRAIAGTVEVHAVLADVASTAPVARPPAAEDLAFRQRTVPEQKELLGGLPTGLSRGGAGSGAGAPGSAAGAARGGKAKHR